MRTRRPVVAGLVLAAILSAALAAAPGLARTPAAQAPAVVELPNLDDSFKFAVLGDFGTGDRAQFQLGEQMAKLHARFPFELVITVGDNIYGGERPQVIRRIESAPEAGLDNRGLDRPLLEPEKRRAGEQLERITGTQIRPGLLKRA